MILPTILLSLISLTLASSYPPTSITLISPTEQTQTVYSHNTINPDFTGYYQPLSCVMPELFTYYQTTVQFKANTPYYIAIESNSLSSISVSTRYNNFAPSLSSTSCLFDCVINITNNCPNPFGKSDYFDQVYVNVNGVVFSYLVDCDQGYSPSVFEWGLFIIIVFITILITLSSVYSKAWSLGGFGIKLGYLFILIYTIVFVTGGVLAVFYPNVINDIVNGCCWVLGIVSVGLCVNQILFPLKIKFLLKPLLSVIRVMDLISSLVGLGVTIGWWLSNKNWILNDIIAVCICIAFIKLFKIVSLKIALVYMVIIVVTEIIIALLIHFILGQSYNVLILNSFNNPLEIQLPTITKVLNLRCSWIPVTQIIFPGVFLSYTRRFDDSRNTHMYLIVSSITFLIACIGWMMVTLLNFHSWPLDTFTQPLLILVVVLFATKRNEIRTVWDGKFYDVQFMNQQDIKVIQSDLARQSKEIEMNVMMQGLKIDEENSRSSYTETLKSQTPNFPEQL